jgi:hypothetical protein
MLVARDKILNEIAKISKPHLEKSQRGEPFWSYT